MAIAGYRRSIAAEPNDPRPYYGLVESHARRGDLPAAEAFLDSLVARDSANASIHYGLACLAVKHQDLEAALREAQLWLRELPVEEVARYADQCYRQSKGTKDAKELLKSKKHYDYLAEQDPTSRPFEHSYYWAAFTMNGV